MADMVISGSDISFGLLEELLKQLKAGAKTDGKKGLTGVQLRAFLEHRNPFERIELQKVLPYADEEVKSNYDYPEGFRIRTVQEQVEILLKHFPYLDASHVEELASGELPEKAEGWAVIPKPNIVGDTSVSALDVILGLIVNDRKFENWREGQLTEKYVQLTEKTKVAHATLNQQLGDFWVIPFQFGKLYRGRSVRRARVCFDETEFGLGVYEVAILMLTHPDRIVGSNQLYMDCAGIEYSPNAGGDFFACLYFYWRSYYRRLGLYYSRTDDTGKKWGAVSGFLSQ